MTLGILLDDWYDVELGRNQFELTVLVPARPGKAHNAQLLQQLNIYSTESTDSQQEHMVKCVYKYIVYSQFIIPWICAME